MGDNLDDSTLVCIGISGYGYHDYCKWFTLKIDESFQPGDPALELVPKIMGSEEKDNDGVDNSHRVTK